MIFAYIAVGVLLAIGVASFRSMAKDLRKLHRSGRNLTDEPVDINGVSPGGVTFVGNNMAH